jgi:preprotein translocase subunit SecE
MFKKIQQFFKDVNKELHNIVWPTRDDLREGTLIVVVFSVILGIFIWIVDNIFAQIVRLFMF